MTENTGKAKALNDRGTVTKRAAAAKTERYDSMREKLKFASALSIITKAERKLMESALVKPEVEEGIVTNKLSRDDIAALKIVLDSKWARINKLLPSLKAVEIEGGLDLRTIVRVVNLTGDDEEGGEEDE